jgi:hypothetical protein
VLAYLCSLPPVFLDYRLDCQGDTMYLDISRQLDYKPPSSTAWAMSAVWDR